MSQAGVVFAFVQQSQNDTHVSFSKAGGSATKGYVNVFGPSHNPLKSRTARVVVEHDGSVSFKDANVANALGAPVRRRGDTAPSTGAAKWSLRAHATTQKYGTLEIFVRAIVAAMKAHATW